MSTTPLLPGITQHKVRTGRLEIAYLEAGPGAGSTPIVLVHGNCSSSFFFQDFMLALAAANRYDVYAPDLRGYGDSESLPVDATWGVCDFSDDLNSFVRALNLTSFRSPYRARGDGALCPAFLCGRSSRECRSRQRRFSVCVSPPQTHGIGHC